MWEEITWDASGICKYEQPWRAEPVTRRKAGWERKLCRQDAQKPGYLFGSLLLFHPIAYHNVDSFPAKPLHDSLEAALLACVEMGEGREEGEHGWEIPQGVGQCRQQLPGTATPTPSSISQEAQRCHLASQEGSQLQPPREFERLVPRRRLSRVASSPPPPSLVLLFGPWHCTLSCLQSLVLQTRIPMTQ